MPAASSAKTRLDKPTVAALQRRRTQHWGPAGACAGAAPSLGQAKWTPAVPGPRFLPATGAIARRRKGHRPRRHHVDHHGARPHPGPKRVRLEPARGAAVAARGQLRELLPLAGIRWLKYPIGHSQDSAAALATWSLVLNAADVEVVGVLRPRLRAGARRRRRRPCHPPAGGRRVRAACPRLGIRPWSPCWRRLATQVRYWQLGDDSDRSFMGCADLREDHRGEGGPGSYWPGCTRGLRLGSADGPAGGQSRHGDRRPRPLAVLVAIGPAAFERRRNLPRGSTRRKPAAARWLCFAARSGDAGRAEARGPGDGAKTLATAPSGPTRPGPVRSPALRRRWCGK